MVDLRVGGLDALMAESWALQWENPLAGPRDE
jgi:hypothetical protein